MALNFCRPKSVISSHPANDAYLSILLFNAFNVLNRFIKIIYYIKNKKIKFTLSVQKQPERSIAIKLSKVTIKSIPSSSIFSQKLRDKYAIFLHL